MSEYTAYCIKNVVLILLVGFCVWFTGSLWGLLGLLFLSSWESDPVFCPHCGKRIEEGEE